MSRMRHVAELEPAALRAVLAEWRFASAGLGVLALVAEADREKVASLQAVCREMAIPLAGAVFPALVVEDGFAERGACLLRLEDAPPAVLLTDFSGDADDAAERIAAAVKPDLNGEAALLLIFDAMVPNVATILDALYLRLADRVHYLGVNAGSETFRPMPCLFDGARVGQNGVLALRLPHHPGATLEHGYRAPEQMIAATSTEGNRIRTIDWRPAFDVYREVVLAQYGVDINRDNFYQLAVHFPFGIVRANDEILVRIPVALAEDDSLFCVGEVPPNAMLTLLQAPAVDSGRTVAALAKEIEELHGPMAGRDLLTFYCAGRRLHIGARAADELGELRALTGAACQAGALSLGEIGSSTKWAYPLFHNAALLCCAWGAP
jgi:hypothetical protein